MRNKYFFIIFISIISSILLSLAFTFSYLQQEITRSVDSQLETMASSIFAAGLSKDMMDNIDDVDAVMSDLFEEERVDRYIRIYQSDNLKLLYANEFGQVASLPLPEGKKLSTIEYGHRRFRVLEVTNGPIVLQVALILDSFLSRIKVLEKNILVFSSGLMIIILLITALSLKAILRPLRVLGMDFAHWSERLSFDFKPMKNSTDQLLLKIQERRRDWKSGEVHEFLKHFYKFAENLSMFLQFSQKQYSVIAHELKTPLTIMRNNLESLKIKYPIEGLDADVSKISTEIDDLSRLIRDFLDWSQQAATISKPEEIYAIKLNAIVEEEIKRLNIIFPDRIEFKPEADVQVFSSKRHAHQLITNLLKNALIHGPQEGLVVLRLKNEVLEIEDAGSGLDEEVLKNLGAPFNKSAKSLGNGLGLAWIKTICDIYVWKLSFKKQNGKHIVRVEFEKESQLV